MRRYQLEVYVTADGQAPFEAWLADLRDDKARTLIYARLSRAELGHLGDWKALKSSVGLCEMRVHYGAGYRVYFAIRQGTIILLVAGSNKDDQARSIRKAEDWVHDYDRRMKP